jgi:formamidopyrimidine-DNA glycosylase
VPELPETETIARDLHSLLKGRRIHSVTVLRPDVLRQVTGRSLAKRVAGARIEGAWRRAKSVVVDLSTGDRLVIQPRFTGAVLVGKTPAAVSDEFSTLSFLLVDGGAFAYRDVRRLGTVALMSPKAFEKMDASLGIEPLDESFTSDRLSEFLRPTDRAVKKVLMDQRRIAGIGNIYASEALWRVGLDPSRAGSRLAPDTVATLRDTVVSLLHAAIAARGTTFRDYRDASGNRGGFASLLEVYGRAGLPCRRCGTRLASTHAIDGRATVFCFRCQT